MLPVWEPEEANGKAKKTLSCAWLQLEGLLCGFGTQKAAGSPGGNAALGVTALLPSLPCLQHQENISQSGNVFME